jgi:Bacterial Ig domain
MWRWVTRGLVFVVLTIFLAPALRAQDVVGGLDSPNPAVPQSGMVFVRGFAIDPAQLSHVDLYVDDQFLHSAPLGQPRIDVGESNPNFPGVQVMRTGFQTGFLASRFGNGPHTVAVRAFTSDGRVTELGRRTITIDNTINQPPFGFIDIPDTTATFDAHGAFPALGWILDTDGIAQVNVLMDGATMQSAIYGSGRPDVGIAYPDFPQAAVSGFSANIDTTRLLDGVHTLSIEAVDRLGLKAEIGRRVVQVFNTESTLEPFGHIDEPQRDAVLFGTNCTTVPPPLVSPPANPGSHVTMVRGWALDLNTRTDTGRVKYVELMIDGVRWTSTDDCGFNTLFNQFSNCYGLPRFDVQQFYPTFPDAPRSGFAFTLDVGALVALGVPPGAHNLKVRVGDVSGQFAELPNRDGIPVFFNCAATATVFPAFGFIDHPRNFDFVNGVVTFVGWALQESTSISSVEVRIDGTSFGFAQYGFVRTDVQAAFPAVFASRNSGWIFGMDTSKLSNARHRLTVVARDGSGNPTEIGSVDFYVDNANRTP